MTLPRSLKAARAAARISFGLRPSLDAGATGCTGGGGGATGGRTGRIGWAAKAPPVPRLTLTVRGIVQVAEPSGDVVNLSDRAAADAGACLPGSTTSGC